MIDSEMFLETYQFNIFQDIIRTSDLSTICMIQRHFDNANFALQITICHSEEELAEKVQLIKTAMKYPHPNLVTPLNYFIEKGKVNNISTLNVITDYYENNLADDIKKRRKTNKYYTETEAFKMIKNLTSALARLEASNVSHKNLKPSNILISANGDYKISGLGKEITNITKYNDIELSSSAYAYISPALYSYYMECIGSSQINYTKPYELTHNGFKSDMFSLGLILLNAWSLESVNNLNIPGSEAETKRIQRIKTLESNFPRVHQTLFNMLGENESSRMTFRDLAGFVTKIEDNQNSQSMSPYLQESDSTRSSNSKNYNADKYNVETKSMSGYSDRSPYNYTSAQDQKYTPGFYNNNNPNSKTNSTPTSNPVIPNIPINAAIVEKEIKLSIFLKEYDKNFLLELPDTTELKEIQEFLLGPSGTIKVTPNSKFYCIQNGKKIYFDENKIIRDLGLKDNSKLEIYVEFGNTSQIEVEFISYKNQKKNQTFTFDKSSCENYTLKMLANKIDSKLGSVKFFKKDDKGLTIYLEDENERVLPLISTSKSDISLTIVEYDNTGVLMDVAIQIVYLKYDKNLSLEVSNNVIMVELINELREHWNLGNNKVYLERNGLKLSDYIDLRSAGIRSQDILSLKDIQQSKIIIQKPKNLKKKLYI